MRTTLSQKSTKVEVYFVISHGYVKDNILFPSLSTVRVPTSAQIVSFLVMAVMHVLNNMPQKTLECTLEHRKFSGGRGGGACPQTPYSVAGLHPPSAQVIAELWLHHLALQLQKRDRSTPLAITLAQDSPGLFPTFFLHTASDQKLGSGKTWEKG